MPPISSPPMNDPQSLRPLMISSLGRWT
jgi:hypothetical protein